MRIIEIIFEEKLQVLNFPLEKLRRPNGEIGRQGVHVPQIIGILKKVCGLDVSENMTMKDLVTTLRNNSEAQEKLRQFTKRNPVEISAYPDDEYHLQDGHHRAFLLNLLGDETIPALVKGHYGVQENLRKWFKEKWVRFGPDGKIRGDCARGSNKEGKPKCLPQAKAHALGKKGRASAAARKRRQDPNANRKGKAINVKTK